jgi:hypothetical protein
VAITTRVHDRLDVRQHFLAEQRAINENSESAKLIVAGRPLRKVLVASHPESLRLISAPTAGSARGSADGMAIWDFETYEPPGFRGRFGDWQFSPAAGRSVFVEVKTLVEPESYSTGVFSRGIASERLTGVLRRAYRQLPRDDRGTLVVVVGAGLILGVSHGIMHGDLFQTLFGRMQVTFKVLPYVPGSEKMAPSFREMFAHAGKHRRLGCVAGLNVGGHETPGLGFYAIHNPFADQAVRLKRADFPAVRQFWVGRDGIGEEIDGLHPHSHWERIVAYSDGSGGPPVS